MTSTTMSAALGPGHRERLMRIDLYAPYGSGSLT